MQCISVIYLFIAENTGPCMIYLDTMEINKFQFLYSVHRSCAGIRHFPCCNTNIANTVFNDKQFFFSNIYIHTHIYIYMYLKAY